MPPQTRQHFETGRNSARSHRRPHFEEVHNKNGLPGELEIPMESFARAVEIMLKGCWDADARHEQPDQSRWIAAVKACGYVQARLAVRKEMAPTAGRALEVA